METEVNMKRYSDYQIIVDRYLRNYELFKTAIENLTVERSDLIIRMEPTVKTVSYSLHVGAGGEKLTEPERYLLDALDIQNDIDVIENSIKDLRRILDKIDRALNGLKPDLREVIELHYFEQLNWEIISSRMHYSARWCQRLKTEALNDICIMIFGQRGIQYDSKFKFIS